MRRDPQLRLDHRGGGEVETRNGQGQPTNDQYTSSAQGNTSVKPRNDDVDGDEPPQPLSQTSECEKSPMGDVQRIMMKCDE